MKNILEQELTLCSQNLSTIVDVARVSTSSMATPNIGCQPPAIASGWHRMLALKNIVANA